MAFKPNYNQQRAERNRAKQQKKQEKLQKKEDEVQRRRAAEQGEGTSEPALQDDQAPDESPRD